VRSYRLSDGAALVLSVNRAPWVTVTFAAPDFGDIARASAGEVARVLSAVPGLRPSVDAEGSLVLATALRGPHASIEIDGARSTAE
jgi:hypothetical protein